MNEDHYNLGLQVQQNCHISDARHAGNYTLCIYLLKMREYYRWENKIEFKKKLENDDVGHWLSKREELWDEMSEQEYKSIVINDINFDPFESRSINDYLIPKGLVYSGGIGNYSKPHFFIGRLVEHTQLDNYTILISSEEYARDLTSPPAMSIDNMIFIRRESLRRMLWEKLEEWQWKKRDGAMKRALSFYDFDNDLDTALDQMTDNEVETAKLHEIGEIQAGELLGDQWHDMLAVLPRSGAEFMARAVRDNLADCLSTLPALMKQPEAASLHFYFANFRGMRKELFPELYKAYQHWNENNATDLLHETINNGQEHWHKVAVEMLNIFAKNEHQPQPHLEKFVLENKFQKL